MAPSRPAHRSGFTLGRRVMRGAVICGLVVFAPGLATAAVADEDTVLAQASTAAETGNSAEGAAEVVRVPEPAQKRQNLTQPAETAPIPSVVGYYEGEDVLFTHTEISDPEIAKHLTRMIGSPTISVPALADVPESALADVYIFANGVAPENTPLGPFGYQADIFDSVPGDAGYSPLRRVLRVTWNEGAEARLLRSVAEVTEALKAGGIIVERPGIVVNMPFVRWPGGGR